MRVADHIKHLERIIENGELLRDQMRRTAEPGGDNPQSGW